MNDMKMKLSFLYIDPLKQGLKQMFKAMRKSGKYVFIHRSIKTRIETTKQTSQVKDETWFLYIDPLKQGLKREFSP